MKTANWVSRYAAWVIRRRIPLMIVVLAVLGGISTFASRVTFDTNYRIWFEDDDPYLAAHDRFIREFGNDDMFVVAFEDPAGILRAAPLATIQRLTDKFWHVPGVIRVDSLTNFQATRAVSDGLSVEDLFPGDKPLDAQRIESASRYIAVEPLITGSLLSANRQVAILRGKFAPNAIDATLPKRVYTHLMQVLDAESARSGYKFHIAGGPITDQAFDQVAQSDAGRLMPLLVVGMVVILGVVFFSLWAIVIPLGVGALTIAATVGVNGIFGLKLDAVTAASPQLLLGISVATVMHVLATFFDHKRAGLDSPHAAEESLAENLVPILLTNAATALGFASFMVGNIVPITVLGFMACVGSVVLTLLAISVVPALLSYYPKKLGRSPLQSLDLSHRLAGLGAWVVKRHKGVILTWIAATVGFALFTPLLTVDSNPSLYFKEGYWFRDSINFMEKRGSGGAIYEIVVKGQGAESVKTAAYMQDVDRFTTYLEHEAPGNFRNVQSLSAIVRSINRAMHDDDPAFYTVPDNTNLIAQYLLMYSLSVPVGQDINDRINVDSSASRITVVRPLVSTRTSQDNMDRINAWAAQNLKHATIEFTGRDVLYTNMGNNLTSSLMASLGFDVLVIIPMLLLMFRNFTAGVVTVFCNVGPLVIVLGLMGLAGITLDVGTLMVASLGLGIAVDDTVHLLANYFGYRKEGEAPAVAAVHTMKHIGTPAAITTLTLVCAFMVFLGADFKPNFYFGMLISVVITLALLADLTLTPALLTWIDNWREARAARKAAAKAPVATEPTALPVAAQAVAAQPQT